MTQPKLIDQVRAAIRIKHYSPRTEEAYWHWITFLAQNVPQDCPLFDRQEVQSILRNLAGTTC